MAFLGKHVRVSLIARARFQEAVPESAIGHADALITDPVHLLEIELAISTVRLVIHEVICELDHREGHVADDRARQVAARRRPESRVVAVFLTRGGGRQ